jgi:hypothetical protein
VVAVAEVEGLGGELVGQVAGPFWVAVGPGPVGDGLVADPDLAGVEGLALVGTGQEHVVAPDLGDQAQCFASAAA